MVNKVSKICKDKKLLENLKNLRIQLNEQRKVGKYCDWTLKTEDGGAFTVHKYVLETVCPFFDTLFNTEFKDKNEDSIILKRCSSSDVLEKIIEFMYTGVVEITADIAKDTLDAALFLGLNTLVDTCTDVLVETVDCENCFELLAYSKTYFCGEDLTEKCAKTIQKYIEAFKHLPSFIKLPVDLIKTLLSNGRHDDCNEEQLFLGIVNWIICDIENREPFISTLMDLLKFEKMTDEFRLSKVSNDNPLWNNKYFQTKLVELVNKGWKDELQENETVSRKKRINCESPALKDLYIFVGYEIRLHQNDNFSLHSPVSKIVDIRTDFGYTTFGGENFVVSGGVINGIATNSCKYYSIQKKCWNDLPVMSNNRHRHRMVKLGEKLYVCGGGSNNIDIFDIGGTKWNLGPTLGSVTSPFGLCTLNECIYALGKDNFQYYDPKQNIALPLPAYNLEPINSAISLNNCIYGFTGRGIATFDIRNNSWINFKFYEENILKSNPEICISNNKAYMMSWLLDNASHARYDISVYNLPDFSFASNYSLYKSSDLSATKSYSIFSFE